MTGKFYFDGVSSEILGIYIVGINNSNDTLPLFGGQSFVTQSVIGHDYETIVSTKKENIKFNLYFTLCGEHGSESFTRDKLYSIGKYFARSVPVEFKIEEDMTRVIKIIPTSGIEIVRFGELKGYFEISFQATTPYWLTPLKILTFKPEAGSSFSVVNKRNIQDKFGHYDIYPKIVLKDLNKGSANLSLSNMTTGKQIIFNNFIANDEIVMNRNIVNAQLDSAIFKNWNKQIFYLTEKNNVLVPNNKCTIDIYLQYPIF